MKNLIVLYGENCAYCKKAKMLIRRAQEKDAAFSLITIKYVKDDSPEGKYYVHNYIPAFYIGGKHVYEGNPEMSNIQSLLTECLEKET